MNTQEKLKRYLNEIEKNDKKGKKINALLQIKNEKELFEEAEKIDEKIKKKKAGKLAGKIIAVKSKIVEISIAKEGTRVLYATAITIIIKIKATINAICASLQKVPARAGAIKLIE